MRDWPHGDRRIGRTVQGGGRSGPDGREDPFRTDPLTLCIDGLAWLSFWQTLKGLTIKKYVMRGLVQTTSQT